MAAKGRLTDDDMDILEGWIGKGPKAFTLLYAITQDGCSNSMFHQKCDNQGPTVTVLYNQHGSVYGGYASASWNSSSGWVSTADTFLFQLNYNGIRRANKFMIQQAAQKYSMHCADHCGPLFGSGSGHDLWTFSGSLSKTNNSFQLNGHMNNFGNSFCSNGIKTNEVNNGTMNVIEMEVYKVADGQRQKEKANEPWRKTKPWNSQLLTELKEDIMSFKPREDLKVTNARILMVGPVGAGKSSFYNTINSVFRGRITHRACSGSAEQSLTLAYTPYTVRVQSGASMNFRLCDTRGLEESTGVSDGDFVYLLEGNLPDYFEFTDKPVTLKTPGLKLEPTPNDQIQCVVFVVDGTTLEVMSAKIVDKMKNFKTLLSQKGIPQLLVLTKIDKLCADVQKRVGDVFKSKAVEQSVEKASQLLGLPRFNVLPVKNYENEVELDESTSILALMSLRQILNFAEDYLDNMADRIATGKEQ